MRLPIITSHRHFPERKVLHAGKGVRIRTQLLRIGVQITAVVRCRGEWRANGWNGLRRLCLTLILSLILSLIGVLLGRSATHTQNQDAQQSSENVTQSRHNWSYGTTIVSPAFNKISCSGFFPLITSL